MTPLLGRTLVLLSLLFASAGAVFAFVSALRSSRPALILARRLAYAYAAAMTAANLLMIFALLGHDFSVSYVAQVGSRSLPIWVTIVSLWSSLEGSILFWGLILGIYIAVATAVISRSFEDYLPGALGVWLSCATFFSFLLAGPAQPFATVTPVPLDGPGPNPLLQNHILMAIHPPFLYLGYVGMTIPFGLASAALMRGRLTQDFIRPLRRWLLLPWTFLTIAITLGGWWAYEVLGWGGYWAWDPVENASFLPWLTATAALHSAIVVERKGMLKGWTLVLIKASFLLTILGTFMTRSGVFNSVHSFTQSSIGPTILVFLAVASLWSIFLLAMRIDRLESERHPLYGASREGMFLINNLLFVLLTLTVLIGTLFPLLVEAFSEKQMSVGRPYFDQMAVPVGVALLFLLGIGPALPWGRATKDQLKRVFLLPLAAGAIAAGIGFVLGVRGVPTLVTLFAGGFAAVVTFRELSRSLPTRSAAVREPSRRRFGGYLVHAGAVVVIIAIAVSSTMKTSTDVQLTLGQAVKIGDYTLTFAGAREVAEPHRQSIIATVNVSRGGSQLGSLTPRMNFYENQREPIGTPDVRTSLFEDLYLSVMNVDPQSQTLGLHAMINPMVAWIWGAVGLMAIGSVVILIPRKKLFTTSLPSDPAMPQIAPGVEVEAG